MKRSLLFSVAAGLLSAASLLLAPLGLQAAEPDGYYSAANGKTGYALKTALHQIISAHTQRSYNDLWTDFLSTDARPNGKVWDMYGDCEFTFGSNKCGNYSNVCDCYNREHSFPKSWFDDGYPMYTDLHHLYPTDGKVNGMRSNYPFGENKGEKFSYGENKLGACTFPGFTGIVFEPDDEYKGDFARTYFYMATCYQDKIASWSQCQAEGVCNGTSDRAFTDWTVNLLLKWHKQDSVSEKERNRNDAVYSIQRNRNPFIDHPEFVEMIWGDYTGDGYEDESQSGGNETPQGELMSEDFEKFTDGTDAGSSAFDASKCEQVLSASGSVYRVVSGVRLATGSAQGTVNFKPFNYSGGFTVVVEGKGWSAGEVTATVGCEQCTETSKQITFTHHKGEAGYGSGVYETLAPITFTTAPGRNTVNLSVSGAGGKRVLIGKLTALAPESEEEKPVPVLTTARAEVNFNYRQGRAIGEAMLVKGFLLTENVQISVSGQGFAVSPSVLSYTDVNQTAGSVFTVTYSGNADHAEGTVTLTSGSLTKTIPVTATRLPNPTVENLAGLVNMYTDVDTGLVYEVQGQVTVTHKDGKNNRIWVQDINEEDGGSMLLFKTDNAFFAGVNTGDVLSGVQGKLSIFNSLLEMTLTATPTVVQHNKTVYVKTLTAGEMKLQRALYQNAVVKVENAHFAETGVFNEAVNYNLSDDIGNTLIFRTDFKDADYLGGAIPSVPQNITGILLLYGDKLQLVARSQNDFANYVLAVDPGQGQGSITGGHEPDFYYKDALGLSRYALKTALFHIIKDHDTLKYNDLWKAYESTDRRADGLVWDFYTNCDFTFDQHYSTNAAECNQINREHSFPKSWFGCDAKDDEPMVTDLHHLYPTDGYANSRHNNYPYAEVERGRERYISSNGSRFGYSATPGYSGLAFEVIDEYKGDIARTYFYMATCYEDKVAGWPGFGCPVCNGTSDQSFSDWVVDMLLRWHRMDPVSQKETDRNDSVYKIQKNRNPYIDHPEFVEKIWGNDYTTFGTQIDLFMPYVYRDAEGVVLKRDTVFITQKREGAGDDYEDLPEPEPAGPEPGEPFVPQVLMREDFETLIGNTDAGASSIKSVPAGVESFAGICYAVRSGVRLGTADTFGRVTFRPFMYTGKALKVSVSGKGWDARRTTCYVVCSECTVKEKAVHFTQTKDSLGVGKYETLEPVYFEVPDSITIVHLAVLGTAGRQVLIDKVEVVSTDSAYTEPVVNREVHGNPYFDLISHIWPENGTRLQEPRVNAEIRLDYSATTANEKEARILPKKVLDWEKEYTLEVQLCNNTEILDSRSVKFKVGPAPSVPAEKPVFKPDPADTVFADSVYVTIECGTDGAGIYYSLDGMETVQPYTEPVLLKATDQISAYAVKEGMACSDTAEGFYIISVTPTPEILNVEEPVFTPEGGDKIFFDSVVVSMECATEGAQILYCLDIKDPDILYTKPLVFREPTVLKAVAVKENSINSAVVIAYYKVMPSALREKADAPVISPAEGTYNDFVNVTLLCPLQDAEIYYRTDNMDSFALYGTDTRIMLTESGSVRAFAAHPDRNNSDTVEVNYIVVETPVVVLPDDPGQPEDPEQPEDPVEPDPIEPDPIEPDPIEPEPIEPDPIEPPVDSTETANITTEVLAVKVYPNPGRGEITVEAPQGACVEVFTQAGVLAVRKENAPAKFKLRLAPGVYHLRTTLHTRTTVKTLVIN